MSTIALPLTKPIPTLPATETWSPQGQWTYEDYLRLPDDGKRYEIIEGVLYMANAPDFAQAHQLAVMELAAELRNFVRAHNLGTVLTASFEVRLPGIAQPVQPDILFVSHARRDIIKPKLIEGAPDLMVEVLSPSTARYDRKVKFDAYERAGVREYWIVNPRLRSVEVYALVDDEYALHGEYGASERVTSAVLTGLELAAAVAFAI
jgi:Uma2 family endonuclease